MTAPAGQIIQLQVGDQVPIGQALLNLIIMGIVTDVNNPNMFGATLSAYKSQAVLTIPVLQGDKGAPGQDKFALQFQNDTLSNTSQLPTAISNGGTMNDTTDLGKFWVFGVTDENNNVVAANMEVWYGSAIGYKTFPVGSPGPPGAFPLIHPDIVVEVPGSGKGPNGVDSWIAVTGSVSNPTFTFHIAAPQGPVGPPGQLALCPDIDLSTTVPAAGDVLVCTSRVTPGAPANLTIVPSFSGGTLAAGNWFYEVTTILPGSTESLPSNEVVATIVGNTGSVVLNWVAPNGGGGIGYHVWRSNQQSSFSTLIATITDINTTTFTDTGGAGVPGSPPSIGVVAGRTIWGASPQVIMIPKLYTIPSSAFTAVQGIGGTKTTVATYAVPQQPWPWKPFVLGSMKVLGSVIQFTPLLVGAEVLLGDSKTGTLVGGGEGNSLGTVNIIANTSSAKNPSQAMTPTNNIGLVPANHTGKQGTVYVNLVSQGMAGTFDYNPVGSNLVVIVLPVPSS